MGSSGVHSVQVPLQIWTALDCDSSLPNQHAVFVVAAVLLFVLLRLSLSV